MSMVGLQTFAAWNTSAKIEVDGFYYYLDNDNNQAQVTSKPLGEYTGDITIPSSFTWNTTNYSVTSIGRYAFNYCSGVTSVTIPNSVTSIGEYAFYNCSGLTSVSIGSGVTSIDQVAFAHCSGLTTITIPESVTSIYGNAFTNCSGLTSMIVESGNTKYDSRDNCNAIIETASNTLIAGCKNTVIPNSVTSIGKYSFGSCSGLTSITIPNSVTSIGMNAFADCSDLTSITIPNSVTSIGERAFWLCTGLTSITIPNSVTSIGEWAFCQCSGLSSITVESENANYDSRDNCNAIIETSTNTLIVGCKNTVIPNNVTSIGKGAFNGCTGLTSVTIPNFVTNIGNSAFSGCSGLTSVTINSSSILFAGLSMKDIFGNQVEEYIIGNNVTLIGYQAFSGCSGLTSVTIPNSVTSIGNSAFSGCSGLTSITIPNSVTSIGWGAFYRCSGLTKVIVSNIAAWCGFSFSNVSTSDNPNPLYYAHHLYSDENTEITNLVIPNGVTSIGNNAFLGCSGLESVTIPNFVTNIGNSAFSGCSGLTKVIASDIAAWCGISFGDVDANPLYYAHHLYSDENTEITNLVIPDGVTSISKATFSGCSGLTSVTIPNSVTSIGEWAFNDCSGLTSITIPNSVTSIGSSAFEYCSGLESVTIPNSVTSIGSSAFEYCSGLTSINIPNSVTEIAGYAFSYCSGLKSVTIPNSVTSIGGCAFYVCSGLESVTIPNSVTSIGDYAFDGCRSLTSVTVDISTPLTIPNNIFQNRGNATLYVPAGSKSAYEAADHWKEFKEIVEMAAPSNIVFADANVKAICVEHWDTDGDGELSTDEAAAVTTLSDYFAYKSSSITSFDELAYFTGLTSIGESAFYYCSGLTSVIIPNSVTSIGLSAFNSCSGLTSITIPNSVTSIGKNAFFGCSGLTSVTIPNSVTSVGNDAFAYCAKINSISVESGNTVYDSRNNCNAIIETASNKIVAGCKNTIIPNSVTSIGERAFRGHSGLTSITIPNSVTSIGEFAFHECNNLTSVIIPNGVTSLWQATFSGCLALTSVTIGNSVTLIYSGVFHNCRSLTSITIPSSVTDIYKDAFEGCYGLTSMIVESGNTVYDSRDNCNAIIETASNTLIAGCQNTVIPNNVTSIGEYAFSGCRNLTSITIPSSVTSIGKYAFNNCPYLTSITIPNSVTSIGTNAFQGCSGLTSVTVDISSPLTITSSTFTNRTNATLHVPEGCTSAYEAADYWKEFEEIVEMAVPNIVFADANVKAICVEHWDTNSDGELSEAEAAAVTTLSDYFANNSSITSFDELQYFTGLTSIDDYAFYVCDGLESVTIPNTVMSIGEWAFSDCTGLTSITIPNSVTTIGQNAFYNCSGLTSVSIPNGVTSLGYGAFADCYGLTSISIPNSVTSIGAGAFNSCSGLISIEVESGNTMYDSRNNCNAIIETASNKLIAGCKNTVIPNSVTSIATQAFENCSALTSITIPNSVTSIGWGAFHNCGLTSVTIPNSVTSIDSRAFDGCSGLTSVTVDINIPLSISSNTFTNRANATLYVPAGCKDAYEAANYWKEFKEIVEMAPEYPDYVTIAMKTGSGASRSMIAYSSKYGLDFTDRPEIKAYIACGYNWKKQVMLVHVKVVPPYTGMVIKTSNAIYDGGEYDVPTTTEDYYYANLLVPVVEKQTVTPTETIDDVEYTNFAIGTLTGGGIGFVRLSSNWTAQNKSYLRVPTSLYNNTAGARELGGFDIEFVEGELATDILNAQRNGRQNDGDYYDIQGRKVKPISKGLYIHNGKKVLVK